MTIAASIGLTRRTRRPPTTAGTLPDAPPTNTRHTAKPRLSASPAARHRFSGGIAAFRSALQRALTALNHPDPEALAASVLSEMVGAMSRARALDDDTAARATLLASREQLGRRLGL